MGKEVELQDLHEEEHNGEEEYLGLVTSRHVPADSREIPAGKLRWVTYIMLHCSFLFCYILRVSLSTAIIPMSEEFGWAESDEGLNFSVFLLCRVISPQARCAFALSLHRVSSKQFLLHLYDWKPQRSHTDDFIQRQNVDASEHWLLHYIQHHDSTLC